MSHNTLQLEASVLVKDDCEHCLSELQGMLSARTGIERVHLTSEPAHLCLHFDPNLVSVAAVERMAREAGGELQGRFQHQKFQLLSHHSADLGVGLESQLNSITGVLHAHVNSAASLIFIAYDQQTTDPESLQRALHNTGVEVRLLPPPGGGCHHHEDQHDHQSSGCTGEKRGHNHGHTHGVGCAHGTVPSFLPPWMAKRWTLLLVAACGVFFALGFLGETFFGLLPEVALGFYLLAYLAGGWDIATHAIPGLLKRRFDTDLLMLAAAAGAAVLGQWSEGAFLLFLFSLGHAGEHYALDRARHAIDALGALMPSKAWTQREGHLVEVLVEELSLGEVVTVRPGDRLPVDGTVLSGRSSVDQSPITGESAPVNKSPGDEVFAGTINQESALQVTVEKLSIDSTLSRVVQMVSEAQEQKSPTQNFTQKFTSKFVPLVLLGTLLLIALPPFFEVMTLRDSFYRAMLLLVASSPCALALGTPASVLAGIAQAARNGVLIKGGLHLENLGRLQVMAFDKTGTLTEGRFEVVEIVTRGSLTEHELLALCASVEQQSNHPIALAIVAAARAKGLNLAQTSSVENLVGLGVKSKYQGSVLWLGSRKLFRESPDAPTLKEEFDSRVEALEAQGKTVVVMAQDQEILGVLALADTPRLEIKTTLESLSALGMKHLVMLTGDNLAAAQYIGSQVGVDDVRAGLMPEEKWKAVKELKEQYGRLAMVGDGINDAPALAAADVGIAMGGAGTAVALETADVALMADDLSQLPFAVGLSRLSRSVIRQNLAFSMAVIVVLIVTSVSGLGELSWTVAIHEGSTLVVVANALRLLAYKGPPQLL